MTSIMTWFKQHPTFARDSALWFWGWAVALSWSIMGGVALVNSLLPPKTATTIIIVAWLVSNLAAYMRKSPAKSREELEDKHVQ